MPPKKKPNEPSKKNDLKKKEKIIEDKTFGLKNKKGAKNQKFIQQVNHQVKQDINKKVDEKIAKKDEKKKEVEDLNQLFRPVVTQKVEKGVDPKTVLCAFFKQGHCSKGDKCKFSHDLTIERKAEKKSVYVDMRDNEDTMENWDEEKLKEVIEQKHGEAERIMPKTTIICKFFLDALETNKYGWFWECPKGGLKCHYRHALPNGFVLKKDKKKLEKKDEISIEDLIERQRAQLGAVQTRITLETFVAWKKKKLKERQALELTEQDRKRAEFKAGRHVGLSGRDMFTFKPEMAEDDAMEDGEDAFDIIREEDGEDEFESPLAKGTLREVTAEQLLSQAREVDGTGTLASQRHWELENSAALLNEKNEAAGGNELNEEDVPIDENLFDEDDDDLDELEESLDDLDLE